MKLFQVFSFQAAVVLANNYPVHHLKHNAEFGSYMNPNPRTPCEGEELQQLNVCANEVLAKLDDCKADDLACECCALQSLSRTCYGLCPGSPSGSFLSVLYDDCEVLNDVNACGLPFKKIDGTNSPKKKVTSQRESTRGSNINRADVVVKSKFGGDSQATNGTNITVNALNSTLNATNVTNSSLSVLSENSEDSDDEDEGDEKSGKRHRIKKKLSKKWKNSGAKLVFENSKPLLFLLAIAMI